MKTRAMRDPRREAFTLIELLIVISIIGILAGLTAAAAIKVLSKKPEVTTRSELSQLDGAIQAFMTKYQIDYVPSQLILHRKYNSSPTPGLEAESQDYILKTIGRNSPKFQTVWKGTGINWITTSTGTAAPASEHLQGQQVLVFLLGGIQVETISAAGVKTYSCIGFCDDVSQPDRTDAGRTAIGPFYNFDSRRLLPSPPQPGTASTYCAYQDPYGTRKNGQPGYYAFFSSYKKAGGYNRYMTYDKTTHSAALAPNWMAAASDCVTLGVYPYQSSPPVSANALPNYVNPTSWQIICSGADGAFGPGTAPGSSTYWNGPLTGVGADDQANFAGGKLGFGP